MCIIGVNVEGKFRAKWWIWVWANFYPLFVLTFNVGGMNRGIIKFRGQMRYLARIRGIFCAKERFTSSVLVKRKSTLK